MPRQGVWYIATNGEGAYALTHDEPRSGRHGTRLTLTQREGAILVFNKPELSEQLAPHFEVRDVVIEYDARAGRYNFTYILECSTLANISMPSQGVDGGTLPFLAHEAGGMATDLSGNSLGNFRVSPRRIIPESLVTANREIHGKILRVLQSWGIRHNACGLMSQGG